MSLADLSQCDLEIHVEEGASVIATVTCLFSQSEMMANPKANAAVRKEADSLEEKGTWDLSTDSKRAKLITWVKKSGIKIHLGKLMSICSEKFAEFAKHLRFLKGRIVFRGDIFKDQEGAAAVFQDLAANPTCIAGINNNIAYG